MNPSLNAFNINCGWIMKKLESNTLHERTENTASPGRRVVFKFLGAGLLMPLIACGQGGKKMRNEIVLSVEAYSYIDRPLIDIILNGEDLGVMNNYGGTGTIVGVRIPFGPQTLSWRLDGPPGTPRNGETVEVKNVIIVKPEQIPPGTEYAGLHIYPDDTAEITFAERIPGRSARGEEIVSKRKLK